MIDQQKLRIAHELAIRQTPYYFKMVFGDDEPVFEIFNCDIGTSQDDTFVDYCEDIDDLIERLTALISGNGGYVVGQTVWKLNDKHEPQDYIIEQVDGNSVEKYTINDFNDWYREEELWPSLEALIEHQLSYWAKQAVKECQHESDGSYCCNSLGTSGDKCRKCGAFYR